MLLKSETMHNLVNAFAGESQARNKYYFYAKVAKKEGYLSIADIFERTAKNEEEHAKLFYDYIPHGNYEVKATYPFFLGKTYDNLIAASEAEHEEWTRIYRDAADTAKSEGFSDIAKTFSLVIEVEKFHQNRFAELAELVKNKAIFTKEQEAQWICSKCAHQCIAKSAPLNCPLCDHDHTYFEIFSEKY